MADHRIGFEIDASKGVQGAKKFTVAIENIKKALSGLDKAFVKTDKEFKGKSFKTLNKAIKEFNSVKISQSALNRVTALSDAAKAFRAPTQAQSKNLRSFALALKQLRAPKGISGVAKLSAAMKGFKAPTRSQTRNLRDFVKAVAGLQVPRNADAIATALRRITMAARGASLSLSGLRSNVSKLGLRKLSIESRAASAGMVKLGGSMNIAAQGGSVLRNAFGALTLGTFTTSVFAAANAVQTFNVTMKTVSGSTSAARTDLAFVRKLASDLAIDLRTAQEQFAAFAAASQVAGLEAAITRDIFKSVSIAMTVLNRTTEDQKLSFLALQQMISKGVVSSEELRRQLGERLPGALEIMARALGVGGKELNSMLKAGSILAKDALPKFAKELEKIFGGGVPDALKRTSSQLKLLRNDFEQVLLDVGEAGFMEALTQGVKDFREAISGPEFQDFVQGIGKGLGNAISGTATALGFLAENAGLVKLAIQGVLVLTGIKLVASLFRAATASTTLGTAFKAMAFSARLGGSALAGTNVVMGVTVTRMGRLAFAARALLTALGPIGIAFIAIEGALLAYNALTDKSIKKSESYANVLDTLGRSAESAKVAIEDLGKGQVGFLKFDLKVSEKELKDVADKATKDLEDTLSSRIIIALIPKGDEGRVLKDLIAQFEQGIISAELFQLSLKKVNAATINPNTKAVTADILKYGKASLKASGELGIVIAQLEILQEFSEKPLPSVDTVVTKGDFNVKEVEKFLKALNQTTASSVTYVEKVRAAGEANKRFLESLPQKALKESQDLLKGTTETITRYSSKLEEVREDLSGFETDQKLATIALTKAQEAFDKDPKNKARLRSLEEQKGAVVDLETKLIKFVALEKQLDKDVIELKKQKVDLDADVVQANEDVTNGVVRGSGAMETLKRATIDMITKGWKKYTPELVKALQSQETMVQRTSDLKALFQQLEASEMAATTGQQAAAFKELGISLETVASVGDRVALIFDKFDKKESFKVDSGLDARTKFIQSQTKARRQAIAEAEKLSDKAAKQTITTGVEVQAEESANKRIEDEKALLLLKEKTAGTAFDIKQIQKLIAVNDKAAVAQQRWNVLNEFANLTVAEKLKLATDNKLSVAQLTSQINAQIAAQQALLNPGQLLLEQANEEIRLLGLSERARRNEIISRETELEFIQKKITDQKLLNETIAARQNLGELQDPTGIAATIAGIKELDEALAEVNRKFSEDLVDAMATFFTTGKLNFKALADSIIADMARIAAQQIFKSIFNIASGGGIGGLVGLGSEGGISGSLPQTQRASLSSFVGAPQFAEGTSNTSGGIPSILHDNEAVIPLSRNRKVPVELTGGGGDTTIIENTFHIDARGAGDGVEDKIAAGIQMAFPLIVSASRQAAASDTLELLSRRTL